MTSHRPRFSARCYRAALLLTPRAHRDRFAADQAQLYDDLAQAGDPTWRLWLDLPRDLVRVHATTRRPEGGLRTAEGPGRWFSAPLSGSARRAAQTTAIVWNAAHLVAGGLWFAAYHRHVDRFGFPPQFDDSSGRVTTTGDPLVDHWVDWTTSLVICLILTSWLVAALLVKVRHRRLYLAVWLGLWSVGLCLQYGYFTYFID
jgi:hypothetical protein